MPKKHIRLNAFHMNSPGHSWAGLWSHPRDRTATHDTPEYWTDFARLAERGKLDAIFLADVIGVYDVYGGTPDTALRTAAQAPTLDPFSVVPLMAGVTQNIGFGVTATVSFEQPYLLARRFSTLDHVTRGRIAWNIVTGLLDSGARGSGQAGLADHDSRYAAAEEFLDVTYKLWEGSWADDALRRDREGRIYTDPARVRKIRHQGERFQVDAIHLVHPSPQRTPYLFQAGASSAGRDFAARHAEAVFINGPTQALVAETVRDLRRRAVDHGRDPYDLKIFLGATLIVAATDAEARDRHESYAKHIDPEGTLALISGWSGIDLSRFGLDDKIPVTESNAMRSLTDTLRRLGPEKAWTLRDLTRFGPEGTRGLFLVGGPQTVADGIAEWIDATDVDGLNMVRLVMPESLEGIVDHLVPELQNRGLFKAEYAEGPLRQKLTGRARLPETHPAARVRF